MKSERAGSPSGDANPRHRLDLFRGLTPLQLVLRFGADCAASLVRHSHRDGLVCLVTDRVRIALLAVRVHSLEVRAERFVDERVAVTGNGEP